MARVLLSLLMAAILMLQAKIVYASHPAGILRNRTDVGNNSFYAAILDGEHGTSKDLYCGGCWLPITLPSVSTVKGYLFHYGTIGGSIKIELLDSRGMILLTINNPTSNDTSIKAIGPVSGVAQVRITHGAPYTRNTSEGPWTRIYEFELYTEVPDTVAPASPSGLSATPGDGQVELRWLANGEPDLGGYRVYYRRAGESVWTLAAKLAPSQTTYTVTGLTNGVAYEFGVSAFDTSGNESAKATVAAVPQDTVPPAAPTGVVAQPGDRLIEVRWQSNTEPDLAGYRVYYRRAGASAWNLAADLPATTTSYVLQGLENGVQYEVGVSAYDTSGNESARSTAVATPADTRAPSPPQALAAAPGNGKVTLSWQANTEPDLAGYRVYVRPAGARDWSRVAELGPTVTGYTVTGLVNEQPYEFAVTAMDNAGNESAPAVTQATPTVIPPNPPAGLAATPGDREVVLRWQASPPPPDPAGYRVHYRPAGTATWRLAAELGPDVLSYTVGGLQNGTRYEFAVRAFTPEAESQPATAVATPRGPDPDPPPAPEGLTAEPGVGRVSLRWQAVDVPDLAGYRIYYRGAGETVWRYAATVGPSATSYTVAVLQGGREYEFGVSALDAAGNESPMATARATPEEFSLVRAIADADLPGRLVAAAGHWLAGTGSLWVIVAGLIIAVKIAGFFLWGSGAGG